MIIENFKTPPPHLPFPDEALSLRPAKQIPLLVKCMETRLVMIAKRIQRRRGASSFGRLGRYILRDAIIHEIGVMARTADYILDREGGRAAQVRFTNCLSVEPELALREIQAAQGMNKRAKGDRTYHLVISFPPGERPSPEILEDIEDVLCGRIGLARHHRLSAVHLDTDHLHLHVAINKIHPESFRCIEPYYDKRRLMLACSELEIKHGLRRTAHGILAQGTRRPQPDRQAMIDTLRSVVAPQLLDEAGPRSWETMDELLSKHGLELRLRGAGLVFQKRDGDLRVKASLIDRRLSLKALTDRMGPYVLHPQDVSTRPTSLYRRYLAERAVASQSGAKNTAADAFAVVKASYERQTRAILEDRALTNVGRNAAFRALRERRQAAFNNLRQNLPRSGKSAPSFPCWAAYVRAQASRGDKDAASLLERWRTRSRKRSVPASASLTGAEAPRAKGAGADRSSSGSTSSLASCGPASQTAARPVRPSAPRAGRGASAFNERSRRMRRAATR